MTQALDRTFRGFVSLCSQGGELVVVDDNLSALAATSLGLGVSAGSLLTTATTATAGTTRLELVTLVSRGLEAEELGAGVGAGSDGVDLGVDLGLLLLGSLVRLETLDVLLVKLLVVTASLLHLNASGLSLLGIHVVVEGETDFLLFNDGLLDLLLLLLAGFTSGALFLLLLLVVGISGFLILAPVALAVTVLLVTASATAGTVLAIHGVSILTSLTLVSGATATTATTLDLLALLGDGLNTLNTLNGVSGLSGSGSITTAATALTSAASGGITLLTGGTVTTGSITTTATTATALTTASLAAAGTTLGLLGLVVHFLELLSAFDGLGGLDLDDDLLGLLLLLLLLDLLLGLLLIGLALPSVHYVFAGSHSQTVADESTMLSPTHETTALS